jgi:phage shock protein PspC (stress-responsive transcriptional regulator)
MTKLYRSNQNRILFGVCGGIADRFGWDPTWVRLAFVVATFLGGPGVLAYFIMLLVVPKRRALGEPGYRALPGR